MRKLFSTIILMAAVLTSWAANKVTTVSQVSEAVTLSDDVDYVITSETPFTGEGSVNITNLDHAVVIIRNIRPSKVISTVLKNHVFINGQQASNGTNCQVKMYAQGAIIMPYAKGFKPLTVYSEQNFQGTAVNDFGLENSGGYMNTLSEAKLNNQIRSFKLKRGYMVTFSTRPEGRGYSRCFIADKEDLELSTLPTVLDERISSYRVFQWYDAQKKGVASDTRSDYVSLVEGSWCYDWGIGQNTLPDAECVPNHIYEDWPSSSACGSVTYSCHMKTNNEPGNSADDHPQDVATVLANWENLMRTGLRLCSESSHDGSMNHLKAFIDSIDARGWRCDVLDLHCYWAAGTFNNLTWYSDNYGNGRPIWISEWVWGASWNNNGAFSVSDRNDYYGNQQRTYDGTKPILDVLNSNDRVERYAYWNSEANCSKIYNNGKELTKLGQYYADMDTEIGYKKSREFIPRNPPQRQPGKLSGTYDKNTHKMTLRWHDYNGEYNRSMTIMVKEAGTYSWKTLQEVKPFELESDYEVEVDARDGNQYRVDIVDLAKKTWQSNEVAAVNAGVEPGDEVSFGTETRFLGGNVLLNGDFELGLLDWTNGAGEPLAAPYFTTISAGGINGGAFLLGLGNSDDVKSEQSVRKLLDLESGVPYYVSAAGFNGNPSKHRISTTTMESLELNVRVKLSDVAAWSAQSQTFTPTTDTKLMIQFRALAGKSMFDEVVVARLFETREEALADALKYAKARAELFTLYNTTDAALNERVLAVAASSTSASEIAQAVTDALVEIRSAGERQVAQANLELFDFIGRPDFADGVPYQITNYAIKSPMIENATDWTRCGTYTGGDQRKATLAGSACWNAWWSVASEAAADQYLAVKQDLKRLSHGLYALECKAGTEHGCESDQHAFLSKDDVTVASPNLSLAALDVPALAEADRWQTLTTPYIYVEEADQVTIGFTGSKQGIKSETWMPFANPTAKPDNRTGWWCATDFHWRYVPLLIRDVDASGWGTVCLPATFDVPEGVQLYEVAGIKADQTALAVVPFDGEPVPGTPYVFSAEPNSRVVFLESGSTVDKAATNSHGLRGAFYTTVQYPTGCLVLADGKWNVVTERYAVNPFTGYVYKLEQLDVLDAAWEAPGCAFLATSGLVPEGIEQLETAEPSVEAPCYNLSGQRVSSDYRGLIIQNGVKAIRQ